MAEKIILDESIANSDKGKLNNIMTSLSDNVEKLNKDLNDALDETNWRGPRRDAITYYNLVTFYGNSSTSLIDQISEKTKAFDDFLNLVITNTQEADKTAAAVIENVPDGPVGSTKSDKTTGDTKDKTTDSTDDSEKPKKNDTKNNSSTIEMDIPSGDTSFKSYTNYKNVTNKSTTAYAINNGQPMPYGKYKGQTFNVKVDDTGMRYIDKNDGKKYYTVAMGTYFGTEGDTFNITTDKGNSFDVIIVDAKGTDSGTSHEGGTWYHQHGDSHDMVEFYISSPESIRVPGGTTGNYNTDSRFSGNVVSISKYQ